jgi:molybdate transport system regulatory protein
MTNRLTLRLDFGPDRRLGPGKVALLEAIAETGSISAAGRRHKMSYRRAWMLVDELNAMFAGPLVAARKGGGGGGGADLTDAGRTVVALYRSIEAKALTAAKREIADLAGRVAQPASP